MEWLSVFPSCWLKLNNFITLVFPLQFGSKFSAVCNALSKQTMGTVLEVVGQWMRPLVITGSHCHGTFRRSWMAKKGAHLRSWYKNKIDCLPLFSQASPCVPPTQAYKLQRGVSEWGQWMRPLVITGSHCHGTFRRSWMAKKGAHLRSYIDNIYIYIYVHKIFGMYGQKFNPYAHFHTHTTTIANFSAIIQTEWTNFCFGKHHEVGSWKILWMYEKWRSGTTPSPEIWWIDNRYQKGWVLKMYLPGTPNNQFF